jgi:hypothetical protein
MICIFLLAGSSAVDRSILGQSPDVGVRCPPGGKKTASTDYVSCVINQCTEDYCFRSRLAILFWRCDRFSGFFRSQVGFRIFLQNFQIIDYLPYLFAIFV